MLSAPGDRQRGNRHAKVLGDGLQALRGFQGSLVDEPTRHALLPFVAVVQVAGEARTFRQHRRIVFARQHTATQGRIWQQTHAFLPTHLGEFTLAATVDQREVVLHCVEALQAMFLGLPEVLHQAPAGFVAASDSPHLTLLHEVREHLQNVFLPGSMIRPMGLIQVDVIRLQPPQAVLIGPHDLATIQGREAIAHGRTEPAMTWPRDLGCQDDFTTRFRLQPAAHDFLRDAKLLCTRRHRIHLCRVEEVDASVHGAIHHGERSLLIGLQAEGHGAHANVRHHKAAASQSSASHKVVTLEGLGRVARHW